MTLRLENAPDACDFSWSLNSSLRAGEPFTSLFFTAHIPCYIRGLYEQVVISFPEGKILTDLGNNAMVTQVLKAKLRRRAYLSTEEREAVAGPGLMISFSTISTFLLAIIPAVLQYLMN
jgi:hypothetical protein